MEYKLYKLNFTTPVHFGTGVLNESDISICADTLFSALYIEALKLDKANVFFESVKNNNLLFSDAFPFIGKTYFLPKPFLYIEPKEQGNSSLKKQFKKIKYLPVSEFSNFIKGDLNPENCSLHNLGKEYLQVMASVRSGEDDTRPFSVGNFIFNEDCGLYIIAASETDEEFELFDELFDSLSYSGIGGKRKSGKGRFTLTFGRMDEDLKAMLIKGSDKYMLLSSSLPAEEELEYALDGASYLVKRRSGFVYSSNYSEDESKKRDAYTFQAGSCFKNRFVGTILDVSEGGNHPVYRYAKGMFMGV